MRRCKTVVVVLLVLAPGCGPKAEHGRAEEVVKTSLDAWKGGEKPQQLTDRAIDIAEPDWKAGYRLLDYQVKTASAQPQQGPRVVVVLTLQNRAGKKSNKEVAYEVIFKDDKRASIGRDAFHVGS
jgi:hypothetical protein